VRAARSPGAQQLPTLPPLGGLALLAAAASAVLHHGRARTLSLAAAVCFVAALAVTVLVHFPLNAEILTWSPAEAPADWQQIQARWGGRPPRPYPAHAGRVRRAHPRPLAYTRRAALIQRHCDRTPQGHGRRADVLVSQHGTAGRDRMC
jgi:hypothetical protein